MVAQLQAVLGRLLTFRNTLGFESRVGFYAVSVSELSLVIETPLAVG